MNITPNELLEIIDTARRSARVEAACDAAVNVDVSSIKFTPEALASEICYCIKGNHNKIAAIKLLRSLTGLGLKASKDLIDERFQY